MVDTVPYELDRQLDRVAREIVVLASHRQGRLTQAWIQLPPGTAHDRATRRLNELLAERGLDFVDVRVCGEAPIVLLDRAELEGG
jgi:3-hydroxyisobutyrate dehydrogenase-like beta-hydroxyacid dehydrogenase